MSELTRKIIDSLMPGGSAWAIKSDSDSDKIMDAEALNIDNPKDFLALLARIRDPQLTPFLDELEREFGISKDDSLTEQQRRDFLTSYVFGGSGSGTIDDMRRRLEEAGFDVQVYANDPAQNPAVLTDEQFAMVAGGANAYAGREDAFARRIGGELIVNGDKFKERPLYTSVAGGQFAYAGNQNFLAGLFEELQTVKIDYPIPTNTGDWPLVFFVGGDATYDVNGKITSIEQIVQPAELRQAYLKIILRYKPLHTWCISFVNFV